MNLQVQVYIEEFILGCKKLRGQVPALRFSLSEDAGALRDEVYPKRV